MYWQSFWEVNKNSLFEEFDESSKMLGFNSSAFTGFKKWISSNTGTSKIEQEEILNDLGLGDFINQQDSQTTFITTIVVKKELLLSTQKQLTLIKGVSSFNKSEVATELLSIVKSDF